MGIKGWEDEEGMEKGDQMKERWREGKKKVKGEVSQHTHTTCGHSLQPAMSFLMTVMRTD